ncbi:MAG: 8-oxo-dGTP diphosphatase [Oscillospiraceae bacterium]|nr:8-oxo-dGTP diphosphatase [Oscillospiraceae bacterium]
MINTTLCHIEKDGKYLMLHRIKKENDLNKDKWVGIGGKFEDKESPEEANRRETLEETGLFVNSARYCGIVTFVSDKWPTEYMHIFHTEDVSGEIKVCDEGELCWVDKKEIYNLPIWVGDKIFLKLIEDKTTPFFSLKLCYEGDTLVSAILNDTPLNIKNLV